MDEARNLLLHVAAMSHIGCVRKNNEDNLFVDGDLMEDEEVNRGTFFSATLENPYHLLGICDGMGGLDEGERAAAIGVHRMQELMKPMPMPSVTAAIDEYARKASKEIDEGRANRGQEKEGTTVALAYLMGKFAHIANVGDSRVYVLRMNRLIQISEDQTRLYRLMMEGKMTREEIRKHPRSNVIDQYLGMPAGIIRSDFVNHREIELCDRDRIMICTDGLTDLVTHEEIEEILIRERDAEAAVKALVHRALVLGGKDNVTVILADIEDPTLGTPTREMVDALETYRGAGDTITT